MIQDRNSSSLDAKNKRIGSSIRHSIGKDVQEIQICARYDNTDHERTQAAEDHKAIQKSAAGFWDVSPRASVSPATIVMSSDEGIRQIPNERGQSKP
jgi:hypothetical protein